MIKRILFATIFTFCLTTVFGQKAIEINTILAHACSKGSTPSSLREGRNEMITFSTGNEPLILDSLFIDWPTTASWRGVVDTSNALAKANTAVLNQSVIDKGNCGVYVQPVNSIPANSKVLLIVSYDFNVAGHDFSDNKDSVYVLYQDKADGTSGHFANLGTNTTPRVLIVKSGSNPNQADTVSYLSSLLVENGIETGTDAGDGATIEYTNDGTPTYTNPGCKIPLKTQGVSINGSNLKANSNSNICGKDTITLFGKSINASAVKWELISGDTGNNFLNNVDNKDTVKYIVNSPNSTNLSFRFIATIQCGKDTAPPISVSLLPAYPTINQPNIKGADVCAGDTIKLSTDSTSTFYTWSASNGSTIINNDKQQNVSLPTTASNTTTTVTVKLKVANRCLNLGNDSTSKTITIKGLPTITAPNIVEICPNSDTLVKAAGATTYVWKENNATVASTDTARLPSADKTYTIIGTTNGCSDSTNLTAKALATCQASVIAFNNTALSNKTDLSPAIYLQGSALNRVMSVIAIEVTNYELVIFDRWGKKTYESTNPLTSWAATDSNGNTVSPGTYYYVVKATGTDNVSHEYKGFITVIGN